MSTSHDDYRDLKPSVVARTIHTQPPHPPPFQTEQSQSSISTALSKLEQTVQLLSKIQQDLEGRIGAVLRPSDPRNKDELKEKRSLSEVPLAETITLSTIHLESVANALQDILNRVEL